MIRRVAAAVAALAVLTPAAGAAARPATVPVVATGAGYVESVARVVTTTITIRPLASDASGNVTDWIGLEGQGAPGLVQDGIAETTQTSSGDSYAAVYAECPTLNYNGTDCYPYYFGPPLSPGDTVKLGVAPLPGRRGYRMSVWVVSGPDAGQGAWEIDPAYPHMPRTAAVWFSELPAGASWLADFGSVQYSHAWPAFRPIKFDEMIARCMTTPGRMVVVWKSTYCGV